MIAVKGDSKTMDKSILDLSNHVGDFMEYWGFKKIHGRIWTILFLNKAPRDAGYLVRTLGVSKALISIAMKDLLRYDVILKAGNSAEGTQLYEANPNVREVIFHVVRSRERHILGQIRSTCNRAEPAMQREADLSPARVVALAEMIRMANTCLDRLLSLQGFDPKLFDLMEFLPVGGSATAPSTSR